MFDTKTLASSTWLLAWFRWHQPVLPACCKENLKAKKQHNCQRTVYETAQSSHLYEDQLIELSLRLFLCRILFKDILRLVLSISLKISSTEIQQRIDVIPEIGHFISVLLQSLTKVDSTSYYDLPVLEITLDCLYHVTYTQGWSMQFSGSGEELCNNMATTFIQVSKLWCVLLLSFVKPS